jgi:uncharacterized Fe-S cluster protein YjdI
MPKPLQVVATRELVVTFDPNVCRHAAECVRGLPAAFDPSRPDWIRLDVPGLWPEQVVEVVARCPSGALQAIRAGQPPQKPLDLPTPGVVVHASKDGPIIVKGSVTLLLPTGSTQKRQSPFSLCRCGGTGSPPFCDGTHVKIGFKSPRE